MFCEEEEGRMGVEMPMPPRPGVGMGINLDGPAALEASTDWRAISATGVEGGFRSSKSSVSYGKHDGGFLLASTMLSAFSFRTSIAYLGGGEER